MKEIKIQWLGHSCFKLTCDYYSVVTDPYEDGYVPGLRPLNVSADAVMCSHGHSDHNAEGKVKLLKSARKSPFTITELDSYHDDCKGEKRGPNKMRIFEAEGIRVAHLGDIGCMPEESQVEKLKNLDAVMIPIGGFYTMEPALCRELLNIIKPRIVIPMHYRSEAFGYDVIGTLEDFLEKEDRVKYYEGDTMVINKDTEAQIAVLKYL